MNFDSKENGGKKKFSYEINAPTLCIPKRRTSLWWPITKLWAIITSINVGPIRWMNFDSMENGGKNSFSFGTTTNIMNPNEKNIFLVANHKNSGHYYEYPCLPHSINRL